MVIGNDVADCRNCHLWIYLKHEEERHWHCVYYILKLSEMKFICCENRENQQYEIP